MATGHSEPARGRGERSDQAGDATFERDRLALELSDVARSLQQVKDTEELLRDVVAAAIQLIPGAEEGSIAEVVARRKIEHKAASSDWVRRTDLIMQDVGQGPCLDAIWDQRTVRVEDLAAERRWPKFAEHAVGLGARSMLSFQLFVAAGNLGALNLYSREPDAFTDQSEHVGLLVAAHAAIAYAGAQKEGQLRIGMESRGLVGQAIGILMERYKLDRARAFSLLIRYSQHSNRKLLVIAEEIVLETEARAR